MIAEIGHFALILALAVAAFQTLVPLIGAERGNAPDDRVRRSGNAPATRSRLRGLCRAHPCLSDFRFLRAERV